MRSTLKLRYSDFFERKNILNIFEVVPPLFATEVNDDLASPLYLYIFIFSIFFYCI